MDRCVQLTYREAIAYAQRVAMLGDERVILMGNDVGDRGGPLTATDGLQAQFGPLRVRETRLSTDALVAAAVGMASSGYRPVVEFGCGNSTDLCDDQMPACIGRLRPARGRRQEVPVVIRATDGRARCGERLDAAEAWALGLPGVKVWAAGSPNDAYQMILAAIDDPNPVVIIEHHALFNWSGVVFPPEGPAEPVEGPRLLKEGRDVTIVASLRMVERIVAAGDRLGEIGIAAELFDLRVLRPMALGAIVDSVRRTTRLLVVEENYRQGGWGGEVISVVTQEVLGRLAAPPMRLTLAELSSPHSSGRKYGAIPRVRDIVDAAQTLVCR